MTRYGFDEETYFTFAYSPVVEPGGEVAGLLDTVVDTTQRVLGARRLGVLQQLGSLPRATHGDTTAAVSAALGVLAEARTDVPFGLVYLAAGRRGCAAGRRPGHRCPGSAGAPTLIPDVVRTVIATGEPRTVTGPGRRCCRVCRAPARARPARPTCTPPSCSR